MYGGGSFTLYNKTLPGTYVNVISAAKANVSFGDRGTVAVPLILDWGIDGEVFEVTTEDFQKNSLTLFGYEYTHAKLKDVREIFRNALTGVFYKVNTGAKATGTVAPLTATAKYKGTRGNDIKIVIASNVDNAGYFDVSTYIGSNKVETQTVNLVEKLVSNDFVVFSGIGTPVATAGLTLSGGTTVAPTGTEYQTFLNKIESSDFNTLVCPTDNSTLIALFVAFTKRMRDEQGVKFQTVVYRNYADYEGIVSVENTVTDSGANAYSLVYWTGGAEASCPVNETIQNKTYDGEYTVDTNYTQTQLTNGLKAGKFLFHKVKSTVKVLDDINTFISYTDTKTSDFSINQIIRIVDQMANDIAILFNNYKLGKAPNDELGRTAFWNDVLTYNRELEKIRCLENVSADEITVTKIDKKSVSLFNPIEPVVAMGKLYVTIQVA